MIRATHPGIKKSHYILMAIIPVVLLLIPMIFLATGFQNNILLAKSGISGTHQINSFFQLAGLVQKIRGLNQIYIHGDESVKQYINDINKETDSLIEGVLARSEQVVNKNSRLQLKNIKKELNLLSKNENTLNSHQLSFDKYTGVVQRIMNVIQNVSINSNLILDPIVASYFMSAMIIKSLPEYAEEIGKIRGIASGLAVGNSLSAAQKEQLLFKVNNVLLSIDRLEADLRVVSEFSPKINNKLKLNLSTLKKDTINYTNLILRLQNSSQNLSISKDIFSDGTSVINSATVLHSIISSGLRKSLVDRIINNRKSLMLLVFASFFVVGVILALVIRLYKTNKINVEQIINSRSMLETILDTIPVGVFWRDREGKYLGANKVYLQDIGVSNIKQIIGKDDTQLNYVQGYVPAHIYDGEIYETGESAYHKKEVMAWPKGPELIEISRVPLSREKGKVFGLLGVYLDITKNQQREDELIRSESHYRQLIELAAAVPWKFDRDKNKFTYVGPQAVDLLGYSIEKWYEEGFWNAHIHPEDRECVKKPFREQGVEKFDYEFEYRMLCADGSFVYVQDNIQVLDDPDSPNIVRGFMFDITEKKEIELSMRLLATAFESQQSMFITDKYAKILRVNEACTKSSGYSEDEVIGKTPRVFSSGYHDEGFYKKFWGALKNNRQWEGEVWNKRKNGEVYPQWLGVNAVVGSNNKVTHYVASFRDLGESYAIKMRERLILESTGDAIYGIDDNGVCTFANPASIRMLGYEAEEELIGCNMHELIHHSYPDGTHYPLSECPSHQSHLLGESYHYCSEVFWRKDGSKIPVECWSQPITRAGNVMGFVISFQDITQRQFEKHQLISERQSADKANHEKSEFLARMSHELRTPLNAIIGFSQLMELDEGISDDSKVSGQEINKAGHHLLSLINDVLDLSKIEAGRISVELETVSLNKMIEESVNLIMPLALQDDIGVAYDEASTKDIMITVDPTRFREVLLNLLSNAVKYNVHGGRVFLETSYISDDRLRISVCDTGPGLAESQQQLLFKPFERLGAEHTKIEGTGIGLVITKRIIEMMGGGLGVESTLGNGSKFWVELSYVKKGGKNKISIIPRAELDIFGMRMCDCKEYKVLYVEDNLSSVRLMEYILAKFPFIKLEVALSAKHAIKIMDDDMFDLIVLDINLPDMSGYKLLEKIYLNEKYSDISVFALSANAMSYEIDAALARGFSEYMTKPIDVRKFISELFKYLGVENNSLEVM